MDVSTILEILREFGPSAVMFIVGIVGIFKVWTFAIKKDDHGINSKEEIVDLVLEALDKREVNLKNKRIEDHDYRKILIKKCNQFASEIIKLTGADSVAIHDYCNGSYNFSEIPFLNFQIIAEKRSGLVQRPIITKKDINTLGTFLIDLEKENIMTFKNISKEEEKYPELVSYLKTNKQHKGVFANIHGSDDSLGFISITYGHNKKVDYIEVEHIIFEYAQKISNLLDKQNLNA